MTPEVKPWEPVRGWWLANGGSLENHKRGWPWGTANVQECREIDEWSRLRVTLANGQTIIVKAKDKT